MIFSTKAEYGVRVMAHLAGRSESDGPASLHSIAEAEGLPQAYLEHLAARLRRAGLVDSRLGARGGYSLARPAESITMAEVVRALEGQIAPIECITDGVDGTLTCVREGEPGHMPCPTKLLWSRVQGSIVRTLTDMTLADLARPAEGGVAQPHRPGEAGGRTTTTERGSGRPAEGGVAQPHRPGEAGGRTTTTERGSGRPAEVTLI